MRCATAIILAFALTTSSAGAQDVCAGAAPQKAMKGRMAAPAAAPTRAGRAIDVGTVGAARGTSLYPGSGAGPIPDVTDWKPRGKIPIGTELIIQGRGLVPGQFVAMLAGSLLAPTTQSASEIRFRVTDASDASPLIVYNTNGQPRTLESAYLVYDPTPYITRVVPTSFGPSDVVTICGTSLFDAFFDDIYSPFPVTGVPNLSTVTKANGKFVRIGRDWLEIVNPSVSPAGDRITFQAGYVYTTARTCNGRASCSTPAGITDLAASFADVPASLTGALTVNLSGVGRWVLGPSLTWHPPVPRITRAFGMLLGPRDPFVLLPTASTRDFSPMVFVEGVNLQWASFRLGPMDINSFSGKTDVSTGFLIPLNASSGQICATQGAQTGCIKSPEIFGGPVISRTPPMPLALRTSYTIEGLNLLPPPSVTGLKYLFAASTIILDATAANTACNMVLQVLEHTANRIVFRIGDPANTAPVQANCSTGPLFQPHPDLTFTIWASMPGAPVRQGLLQGIPFYLKP